MAISKAESARKMTGYCPCRKSDGNRKLKPSVTPNRIAAVRLANLKKLFPILRGEMNRRISIMPMPSCEKRKKKVDEIISDYDALLSRRANSFSFVHRRAIDQHKELP